MNRSLVLAMLALAACGCAEVEATSAPPTKPTPKPTTPACSIPERQARLSTGTPSPALLDAFGVLRRPAQAGDRPPDAALAHTMGMSGLMLDAARQLRPSTWLLPVEDLTQQFRMPARCIKGLPAEQRRAIRKAEREAAKRPPEPGVALISGTPPGITQRVSLTALREGLTYQIDSCSGPLRDKLGIRGLVADDVTKVTVTAADGAITEAMIDANTFTFELPRPTDPRGLPSSLTYVTASGPKVVNLRPDRGLAQPCSPPERSGRGERVEPPKPLDTPKGAKIELRSSRWEAEDTLPLLVAATYSRPGGRCLIVDTEANLKRGKHQYRYCVKDAPLRRERYLAEAARLPNGDVILAGFVDREQASSVTMEGSTVASGARRLPTAEESGAFFLVTKGPRKRAGTYDVHVALRGKPVRYAGRRTIRLPAG